MHTNFSRLARMASNDAICKRNCWRLRKSVYVSQDFNSYSNKAKIEKKNILNFILVKWYTIKYVLKVIINLFKKLINDFLI